MRAQPGRRQRGLAPNLVRAHCFKTLPHPLSPRPEPPFRVASSPRVHVCMVFEKLGDNLLTLIKRFDYRGIPIHYVKDLCRQVRRGGRSHSPPEAVHSERRVRAGRSPAAASARPSPRSLPSTQPPT